MNRRRPEPLAVPEEKKASYVLYVSVSYVTNAGKFTEGDLTISKDGLQIISPVSARSSSASSQEAVRAITPEVNPATGPDLTLQDLEELGIIGSGSSGVAKKVRNRHTGALLVLKVIQFDVSSDTIRKQVTTELRTLYGASHQNIVKYHQAFFDNGAITIVMEYCDGGSLADVLRAVSRTRPGQAVPEKYIAEIARQVPDMLVKAWHAAGLQREHPCMPDTMTWMTGRSLRHTMPGHTAATAATGQLAHWRSPTVAFKPRARCLKPVQGALRTLQQELQLQLAYHQDPFFVEDLMHEVALTANKITAMYSGPSPFSALDFPELTAFTNVAGPGSCLVYNSSGHLALQPHGSGSMTVQSDEADSDSEDEEEVGSRQAAADMETMFGENEEEEEGSERGSVPVQLYAIPPKGRRAASVPASDFQQHVDSAKQELAATADAVVRDLHSRFLPPEHARGLAVVYAHYWDKQPSDEDFFERLAIQKLSAQQSAFVEVMRCQAEHRVELSSAAANPAKETTKLWRYLAGQPITKADILEPVQHMQVVAGLVHLHKELHVVHRDIKPSNLLLTSTGALKISDFGVSGQLTSSVSNCLSWVGTVTYMSPERIKGDQYSFDSDMWSLGLTLVECALGRFPYPPPGPSHLWKDSTTTLATDCLGSLRCASAGDPSAAQQPLGFWELLEYIVEEAVPVLPRGDPRFSAELCDFVAKCLVKDARQRATIDVLSKHAFLRTHKGTDLAELLSWAVNAS
ncbi:hypothetical protein QJQ45_026362 [Haematococcus lacustris]|nr:hypothetical protein QJQ45_026362 [Haematococcus lacustris]